MIVASPESFRGWNALEKDPSRRERCDPYLWLFRRPDRSKLIGPNHTVPYGTVAFSHAFQAINCLATISMSLRDNFPPTLLRTANRQPLTANCHPHRVEPGLQEEASNDQNK
jgi:hypothetical protein